jgi:phosphatidate phosphatase APP1
MLRASVMACVFAAAQGPPVFGSDINRDERVVFFPTAGRLSDDGTEWIVPIHGWIFEPEQNDLLRRAALAELKEELGLAPELQTTKVFDDRISRFLVDNERDQKIGIAIGDETFPLPASDDDGHILGTVRLRVEAARRLAPVGRLRFRAVTSSSDKRDFSGVAHLIASDGITVISDIDDTVKVTEVTDTAKLVANTFLRKFTAVEGMAGLYQRWAKEGAAFHFVSSSPYQLYEPLAAFLADAGFPDAVWHLKRLRLKDASVLSVFADPFETKLSVIEEVLEHYPQRTFVLVGDSGEKDPEVYGELARRHPRQVLRVYIRDVTGDAEDGPRHREAFRDVAAERWTLFTEPGRLELPRQ